MSLRLLGWEDTIIALATPPGIGAIGVIRLSGKNAIKIVNQLFASKNLELVPSHTLHVGVLRSDKSILDEVVVSVYKAPRSYTGEDVIEISTHGSPYIQQQILAACNSLGARLAKPGEFTQRAFLNGKMDLTQAEAVADLIVSNTEASQKSALQNMRGGFSHILKELRDQLIQFSALIELELDFSQEDVEFADRSRFQQLVTTIKNHTEDLINSFRLGNVIKNGVSVAIIGKPNAGKSTLLNALLNEDRAIVSEIPGTTRDTIEEVINIDGILFRLIDTAGIRPSTLDSIESVGIEKSRKKMKEADIVIYLFDVIEMYAEELKTLSSEFQASNLNYLLVGNKIDMEAELTVRSKFTSISNAVFISASKHSHLEALKERMVDLVLKDTVQTENVVVSNARHYHSLVQVKDAITQIEDGLINKIPGDLLALDIRRCLQYLGEITGEITNEDQLDYIFSKFCIGK
jgi:tRNA modification GTPase